LIVKDTIKSLTPLLLYMSALLNLSFWFNLSPDPLMPGSFRFLELVFCALILFGVVAKIVSVVKKSDYLFAVGAKKLVSPFFWMGVLGLILLVLDYERVTFFNSRFWYLLWALGFIVWMVFVMKKLIHDLPERKKIIDDRKKLEKWLPKKKN